MLTQCRAVILWFALAVNFTVWASRGLMTFVTVVARF